MIIANALPWPIHRKSHRPSWRDGVQRVDKPEFAGRLAEHPGLVGSLTDAGAQRHSAVSCPAGPVPNRAVSTDILHLPARVVVTGRAVARRRTARDVLKELSGVTGRLMIIRMTTPACPQQRYDHRLRDLVQRTGDVRIATDLGVPRSTARGWLGKAPKVVVSLDVADLRVSELQQEDAPEELPKRPLDERWQAVAIAQTGRLHQEGLQVVPHDPVQDASFGTMGFVACGRPGHPADEAEGVPSSPHHAKRAKIEPTSAFLRRPRRARTADSAIARAEAFWGRARRHASSPKFSGDAWCH